MKQVEGFIDRVKKDDPEKFAQLLLPDGQPQQSERSRQLQRIEENQKKLMQHMQQMQQTQFQIASLYFMMMAAGRIVQPTIPQFPLYTTPPGQTNTYNILNLAQGTTYPALFQRQQQDHDGDSAGQ